MFPTQQQPVPCRHVFFRASTNPPGIFRPIQHSGAAAAMALLAISPLGIAAPGLAAKDTAPIPHACQQQQTDAAALASCLSASPASQGSAENDAELFAAGYWLAKTGDYGGALQRLRLVSRPDGRTLTYIGFSLRKLGRTTEAFGFYERALEVGGENAVTRSYLGEAYLAVGNRAEAERQLERVADICGAKTCEAYLELAAALRSATERSFRREG